MGESETLNLIFGGHRAGIACLYGPKGIAVRVGITIVKQLSAGSDWQSSAVVVASDFTESEVRDEFSQHPDVRRMCSAERLADLAEAVVLAENGVVLIDSISALEAMAGVSRRSGTSFRDLKKIRDYAAESNCMILACGTADFGRKRLLGTDTWREVSRDLYVLRPQRSIFGSYLIEVGATSRASAPADGAVTIWIDESTVAPMPVDPTATVDAA